MLTQTLSDLVCLLAAVETPQKVAFGVQSSRFDRHNARWLCAARSSNSRHPQRMFRQAQGSIGITSRPTHYVRRSLLTPQITSNKLGVGYQLRFNALKLESGQGLGSNVQFHYSVEVGYLRCPGIHPWMDCGHFDS